MPAVVPFNTRYSLMQHMLQISYMKAAVKCGIVECGMGIGLQLELGSGVSVNSHG